jgi:probable rRNA maturation factor
MPSPRKRTSLQVSLVLNSPDTKPPLRRWLAAQLRRVAALADVRLGSITLVIVDDAQMGRLHGQYKDDPSTTDVLTFDLRESPDPDSDEPIEGDIILCVDEAARQAARRGHETRVELLLYAVHGLLHLLGYDDRRAADFRKMHAKEDDLLTAAGFGPVFHGRR